MLWFPYHACTSGRLLSFTCLTPGAIFGVTAAIECLAVFVAPILFGTIYEATVQDDPRFVFKVMAGLMTIPSALTL